MKPAATRFPGLAVVMLLVLSAPWTTPGPVQSNPIAPTFFASDGAAHLYEIYLIQDGPSGGLRWFPFTTCDLPTHGNAGAAEIDLNEDTWEGIVQGGNLSFLHQVFGSPYSGCLPLFNPRPNGAEFTGFEYVDGILYGAAISEICGSSYVGTLDPFTGAFSFIGATGVGPIAGLAWDGRSRVMYGVTACEPSGASSLVRIDPDTGAASLIGSTGVSLGSLEAVDYSVHAGSTPPPPSQGAWLFAGGDAADGGNLYRIDTNSGAATVVPLSGPDGIAGMTGLASTGVGVTVAVQSSTWGAIKAISR